MNFAKSQLQTIKVASPIQAVLNTLNKAKEIYFSQGIDLHVIKTDWTEESIDKLSDGSIDGLIYTNVHVFKAYNEFLKKQNKELFSYIQPFYHSKYGLYINRKNQKQLTNLETVKKYQNLKVLLAVSFAFIQPCDMSRSLLLLKNLGLINIPEHIIKTKKLAISLEDISNPYNLQFIKTSQIPYQFEQPDKFDLMANWPAFMKYNKDFIRIGSNISDNQEPQDELVESYAIALISRQSNENSKEIKLLQQILQNPEVKKFHANQTTNGEIDYVMISDPEKLKDRIVQNWL
ncbi:MetQ/NlpA family ABC transporter substrate-binding protein ['Opuntia sp.' phytoplasma]|uniref:MetQ/NlpA family ABC transporter substrate-binding protein n=1 Tax=Candidatus Phytoplasma asiaticum TaxID=2763338 RepID=A0AAX3B9G3_9MOLU|nr:MULTISPECIES: MetQ/NlpA family ABC transporter substrate-binding protein [Phytoplasma]MDO8053963.1 MetQ/NlpA family ABC transporter substrate-binding protein ['Opuntia sp.' phytoplasma]MDO8057928.1 MetQ/NlpA family ABC transporter substrate-binding protein ['Opuntia sp.' phytoplasma]UQV27028.1 MetQ/NlpA family ABC transporter substrate-binding protein ['Parthenium hysterophorus' phyllody phytoplasma]